MKSILLIHPALPYPPQNGADQALLSSIVVAQQFCRVLLIYPVCDINNQNEREAIFSTKFPDVKLCPYFQIEENRKQPLIIRIWWSLSRLADKHLHYSEHIRPKNPDNDNLGWMSLFNPQSSTFIEHINKVINDNNIDVIQVELHGLMSTILGLPSTIKKIFVHHEIVFVRHALEQDIPNCSYFIQGLYEESKMMEISLLNKYDGIITLSDIDKQKLLIAGVTSPIYSSFATVDATLSDQNVYSNGLELSFIGTCIHSPNYHGLQWFLDTCWPKLLAIDPNYKLRIIGNWPDIYQKSFLAKYTNISFTGFVENTREYLQGTILIVPILVGSGIRMKILEGASIGIPIVTTAVGVEGIRVSDGFHCSIANTSEIFVEKIIELRNCDIQKKYIDNFRKFVIDNYSMEALAENRKSIYQDILTID